MRISDGCSDVCSSDLGRREVALLRDDWRRLDRTIGCRVELRRVIVDLFDSCRLNFAASRTRKASRRTTRGYDSRKLLRQIFLGCDRKYDLPAITAGCLIGG